VKERGENKKEGEDGGRKLLGGTAKGKRDYKDGSR